MKKAAVLSIMVMHVKSRIAGATTAAMISILSTTVTDLMCFVRQRFDAFLMQQQFIQETTQSVSGLV